jgi:acyl-CoA thioester hydrolase
MDLRRDPQRLSLASYPLSHSVTARLSDLNAGGHLHTVALASFYDDARDALQRRIFGAGGGAGTGAGPASGQDGFALVVAQSSVHYLGEATYPGTYLVGVGVGRVGQTSFTHSAGLFLDGVCLGLCDTVVVHLVDGAPAVIPPPRRAQIEDLAFPSRPGGTLIPGQQGERSADAAAPAPRPR